MGAGLGLLLARVARGRVETVEEIVAQARSALDHGLDRHRLMLAPDCGLGFLPGEVAEQKLVNMVRGAGERGVGV